MAIRVEERYRGIRSPHWGQLSVDARECRSVVKTSVSLLPRKDGTSTFVVMVNEPLVTCCE